jgi:TonB family protein
MEAGDAAWRNVPVRFSITVNFSLETASQTKKSDSDDIFMIVEKMPTFQGGDVQKFSDWVADNVQYPAIAKENGIQGKVYLGFVVEKDGTINHVQILRSVDASLDNEAVRVLKALTPWTPGEQRGELQRVRFSITVLFDLGRTPIVKADSLLKTGTVKK